jgi:obg-like ATPase 1
LRDVEIIDGELRIKDSEMVEKWIEGRRKDAGINPGTKSPVEKEKLDSFLVLKKCMENLEKDIDVRDVEWSERELELLRQFQFISSKPVVSLVNMSVKDYVTGDNKWIETLRKTKPAVKFIPFSAEVYMKPASYCIIARGRPDAL